MADWNIRPRATACCHCKNPFAIGDKGHSLLLPNPQGLERIDLCEACFAAQTQLAPTLRKGAWTFLIPPQKKRNQPPETLQRETADHLLRTLLKRNHLNDRPIIYLLSILLERKKQLIERRTTINAEGLRVRIYEQRGTGDIFTIIDPQIQPIDIPAIQRRIITLLESPPQEDLSPTPILLKRYRPHRNIQRGRVKRFWKALTP